jgi:hypothetical protein
MTLTSVSQEVDGAAMRGISWRRMSEELANLVKKAHKNLDRAPMA